MKKQKPDNKTSEDTDASGAKPKARTFRDLVVWRKSHDFVLTMCRLTRAFSKYELFGLISQIRRSAVSIPANIAEGFKRRGGNYSAR